MKKVLLVLILFPGLSFASGPPQMDAAMKQAFEDCGGVRPERGRRPSDEDAAEREAFDDCMSEKGYAKPEREERGERRGPPRGRGQNFDSDGGAIN